MAALDVLPLLKAKSHLNIKGNENDEEISAFIDAAVSVIGQAAGPLEPVTVTQRLAGDKALLLATAPVISLTSVTPTGGTAVDPSSFTLDARAGIVYSAAGVLSSGQTYAVVYQAGYTTVPPALLHAVKEMVRHLWKSQRGAVQRPNGSDRAGTQPGAPGYLIPHHVAELVAPYHVYRIG